MSKIHIGEKIGQNHAAASTLETWHKYDRKSVSDLSGQTLLILGSGIQRWEDYFLEETNTPAYVINLDPIYGEGWIKHEENAQLPKCRIGKQVCAVAQTLPIKNEKIDAVFSTWSMPLIFFEDIASHEEQSLQIKLLAKELFRVVKFGGIISLSPINNIEAEMEEKQNQANFVLRHFMEEGFDCTAPEIKVKRDGQSYIHFGLRGIKNPAKT